TADHLGRLGRLGRRDIVALIVVDDLEGAVTGRNLMQHSRTSSFSASRRRARGSACSTSGFASLKPSWKVGNDGRPHNPDNSASPTPHALLNRRNMAIL